MTSLFLTHMQSYQSACNMHITPYMLLAAGTVFNQPRQTASSACCALNNLLTMDGGLCAGMANVGPAGAALAAVAALYELPYRSVMGESWPSSELHPVHISRNDATSKSHANEQRNMLVCL